MNALPRLAMVAAMFSLCVLHAPAQQPISIDVTANPLWTDTGMALAAGDAVTITASGSWTYWLAQGFFGPDGDPRNLFPGDLFYSGANQGALVGYVGANPYFGGGEYFGVGTGTQFTTQAAGELWLGINDDASSGNTFDNFGFVTAEITATHIEFLPIVNLLPPSVRRRQGYNLSSPTVDQELVLVQVTDGVGNPVPNVAVKVTISGDNSPAGHVGHTPESVHGWIFKPTDPFVDGDGVPIDTSSMVAHCAEEGSADDLQLDLQTDSDGVASFDFIPAEVSGIDTLTVVTDDGASAKTNIIVAVQGLTSMQNFIGLFDFSLWGVTGYHPENWFVSQSGVSGLRTAAQTYEMNQTMDSTIHDAIVNLAALGYDFPNEIPQGGYRGGLIVPKGPEILFINDISLIWGGMFDVDGNFTSCGNQGGHGGHRDGSQVDLKSNHLVMLSQDQINNGDTVQNALPTNAVGDDRLINGSSPFSNADFYIGANGKPTFYDKNIRNRMNHFVMQIHYERLQLLLRALASAGGSLFPEGNHIHVKFP